MKTPFYDLEPRDGSHYLLQNGKPIARFDELATAEAVRIEYVAELAEKLDKENAAGRDTRGEEVNDFRSSMQDDSTRSLLLRQYAGGEARHVAFRDQ